MGHGPSEEIVVERSADELDSLLEALPDFGLLKWVVRSDHAVAEVLAPADRLRRGKKWWRIGEEQETHLHLNFESTEGLRFVERVPSDGRIGSKSIQWVAGGEPFVKAYLTKVEGRFRPDQEARFEALRDRA